MSRFGRLRISKRTRRSLTGFLTVIVLLLLVFQGIGLRPVFVLQQGALRVGTLFGNAFTYVRTYDEFQQELSVLRRRVETLALETSAMEQLRQENGELRALLAFQEEESFFNILPAQVLTRALDDQRAQVIVGKGAVDGLVPGQAVVVEDGVLVGTVERVREHTATIRLLSDHRSRIASKIASSETIGVSEGARGSLLTLNFIPQHSSLRTDDLVLSSGLESMIPEGLVVGFVTTIVEDDTQPFKSATIEPIVDARLYQTVGIILVPDEL